MKLKIPDGDDCLNVMMIYAVIIMVLSCAAMVYQDLSKDDTHQYQEGSRE